VLITAGQIEKAGLFLTSAENIARQEMTAENAGTDQKKLLGKIAVAIAYQHSFLDKPDIILDYCRVALENLSDEDPLWFSWGWYSVGMAQLANEDIFESTESLKKALEFGKKSGNIYLICTIGITLGYTEGRLGLYKISYKRSADLLEFLKEKGYADLVKSDWTFAVLFANMAAIQYFWGDLDGAFEKIKIAYDLCIKEANITSKVLVLVIYSVLLHGQGDPSGAEIKLKELEAIIQKNKIAPFLKSMYIGWKATFLIIKNELEKAHAFLTEHGVGSGKTISYAEEYRYIPYALLLMSEYKFEEASRLLSKLYDMASAQNLFERMIEIKVFFAIVQQAKGEKDEALDSLNESLSYAAPDEILMYHLNYLDQIQVLLTEIFKNHATGKGKLPNQFINKLKFAIDKRRKVSPGNLRLTTRELETLQLMAENLSNQEIADQLFISLNTVKTRLKSLYIKLEVNNRTKAVAKAKEFRLL
jgi:LuxR family maltose regulon positive regulatory protein